MRDVDALNAGYAGQLLEQYLENPSSVPPEWRALFESGNGDLATALPGLEKLAVRRGVDAVRRDQREVGAVPAWGPAHRGGLDELVWHERERRLVERDVELRALTRALTL